MDNGPGMGRKVGHAIALNSTVSVAQVQRIQKLSTLSFICSEFQPCQSCTKETPCQRGYVQNKSIKAVLPGLVDVLLGKGLAWEHLRLSKVKGGLLKVLVACHLEH